MKDKKFSQKLTLEQALFNALELKGEGMVRRPFRSLSRKELASLLERVRA